MKVYVGQTRSRKLIAELSRLGFGEMTQPYEYPPRRLPWALDNGAFADHRKGRPVNVERLLTVARKASARQRPDFVVAPDVIAGGRSSLRLSLRWRDAIADLGLPVALVVQDGMSRKDVEPHLDKFDVLFVGGTLKWKIRTGASWATLARELGKSCHVGRVGTRKRVMWSKRIGANSIDSCLPLWSREKLDTFVHALGVQKQLDLFISMDQNTDLGCAQVRCVQSDTVDA